MVLLRNQNEGSYRSMLERIYKTDNRREIVRPGEQDIQGNARTWIQVFRFRKCELLEESKEEKDIQLRDICFIRSSDYEAPEGRTSILVQRRESEVQGRRNERTARESRKDHASEKTAETMSAPKRGHMRVFESSTYSNILQVRQER